MRNYLLTACLVALPLTANSVLIGRIEVTSGAGDYQAYFDDLLNVTWSLPVGWAGTTDGKEWADNFSLGGVDKWYLPSVNEFGHMYNINGILSNEPNIFSIQPICNNFSHLHKCLPADGLFYTRDTQPMMDGYGEPYDAPLRYSFQHDGAFTGGSDYGGWAITGGDPFAPVPIPPAIWLFGSGLLGLIGVARRKANA